MRNFSKTKVIEKLKTLLYSITPHPQKKNTHSHTCNLWDNVKLKTPTVRYR
jgi:hypothetical protein